MQQRDLILQALGRPRKGAGESHERAAPGKRSETKETDVKNSIKGAAKGEASVAARQKVEAFSQVLEERKDICWQDLVPQFRENYYEGYDEMASALFSTDDPLVVYNTVRYADFKNPQEVAAHARFIGECDAEKHQVSLRALARTKIPELLQALNAREDLPQSVKGVLTGEEQKSIEAALAGLPTATAEVGMRPAESGDQPKAAARATTKARTTRTKTQSKEEDAE